MRNELNELAVALISSTAAPGLTAVPGAGPSASASGASPTAVAAAALGTLGPGVGGVGGVRRPGLLAPRVLLTRAEWGVLRSAFGRPRRLSLTFLKQQRVMLEAYRWALTCFKFEFELELLCYWCCLPLFVPLGPPLTVHSFPTPVPRRSLPRAHPLAGSM